MTACVACETALRDYQENVSTDQTHGQTDGQTKLSLCAAMLRRRQKTTTLEKNDCSSDLLDTPSSAGIYSVLMHCIYTWYFFFRLAGNTAINFTRILTRPTPGTCDVSEV